MPDCERNYCLHLTMGTKKSRCLSDEKNQLLEGLNVVITIHDYINVSGKDNDANDQNQIALIEGGQQVGLTPYSNKCPIRQPQISLFGVLYGKNGVNPDSKKIHGILDIPPPTDVTWLQSFFGMVNFIHNFIPHMSSHTLPLWALLTKRPCSSGMNQPVHHNIDSNHS